MNQVHTTIEEGVLRHAVNGLYQIVNDMRNEDTFNIWDLHNKLFNEDYFIIGYYNASEWIKAHKLDVFDIISQVQQYEKYYFNETRTEVNSEAMVNMYAYIRGEELLNSLELDTKSVNYTKSQMTDILLRVKGMLG
jgi:ribosome-associated toxin RatA of RatAB toxin-antitoxin module